MFARKFPAAQSVEMRWHAEHFLARPTARDFAWYEPVHHTVNAVRNLIDQPDERVVGVLAHELGHAVDLHLHLPGAERRADRLARSVIGVPIRYDSDDIQNVKYGVCQRPAHLRPKLRGRPE